MPLDLWYAFSLASIIILAIPGPSVVLVISYALRHGSGVALCTALGVGAGHLITMSVSLTGLGALVAASDSLFTAMKWAGAMYLIWLGSRMYRAAPESVRASPLAVTQHSIFSHCATVSALNPKSIAFFIAFVPQFVSDTGSLPAQFAIMTGTFVVLATLKALGVAWLVACIRNQSGTLQSAEWVPRTGGVALVGVGLFTASTGLY